MSELRDKIKENGGELLYLYIRGSHSHGTAIEGVSDIDTGAVYMCSIDKIIDLGINYKTQIESNKHDDVAYELNRFMRLLLTSNPTMLESLFIDDEFVLYEHPIMTEIKRHREKFITKECFNPMFGFARQQIQKCMGYNKKCVNPVTERLEPLDFTYTFRNQGSTKILNWLEHRGMKQKYCGLVNIPNMDCMYALFYDWGNHFLNEKVTLDKLLSAKRDTSESETIELTHQLKHDETLSDSKKKEIKKRIESVHLGNMARFISSFYNMDYDPYNENFIFWYESQNPIGYKGLVSESKESNELRLSSVSKGEIPLIHIHYNKDKYTSHCKSYREYQQWLKERNEARYESNKGKTYDAKNIAHCMRIINMCIEIASGKGFNVNRKNIDRDFLLDIRNHKYEYDDLMKIIEEKKKLMDEAMAKSTLPDKIDIEFVNNLLLGIRKRQIIENFSK